MADADIQFEQKFELIDENADKDLWGVTIKKGIFDADKVAKEGILAVKEEKQASAIDEYAVITVSYTHLQDYRDQGRIPYIQLGGKILYRQSDIERLLEENYHPALV